VGRRVIITRPIAGQQPARLLRLLVSAGLHAPLPRRPGPALRRPSPALFRIHPGHPGSLSTGVHRPDTGVHRPSTSEHHLDVRAVAALRHGHAAALQPARTGSVDQRPGDPCTPGLRSPGTGLRGRVGRRAPGRVWGLRALAATVSGPLQQRVAVPADAGRGWQPRAEDGIKMAPAGGLLEH
jgi:hypothetical protein